MIPQANRLYEFDPFVLDEGNRILLKDGATVRLTPKAFETLLVLVQNAVQVVEKEQLLKEVWPDSFVEEGSLSRNIHELRKALGDDSSEPRYIETIPKRGYRFVAPVKVSAVNAGQTGLTGVEGDATVIEKHTFARVINKEFEETDMPVQAAPLPSVVGVKALRLPGVTAQRKRRAAAIVAVLLLACAVGVFVYLKRSRVSTAPMSRAKSTLVRLTNNNAMEGAPVWSPDGSRIVFWSNRDGKSEIYVMDADGSNVKRLTSNLVDDLDPKWSPDSRKILFDSERDGNKEIYVMDADGGNQTRRASDPAGYLSPKWSADGRILFISNREGRGDIYAMDSDGGNVTRLTKTGAGQAACSPDGSKVAFVSPSLEKIGGHFWLQIYVMDSDGGNIRMLTRNPDSSFVPCWSPDGASVAFVTETLPRANIFQIDLDGGNLRRVTAGPKFDGRPAFSPDGSKLAFQSNRDGNYEIYVMNLR